MGPKPTAVDQAGRPPRKLRAYSLSFQLNAQAEAINPALFTITITLSVVSLFVVVITPESFSKDTLTSRTSGLASKTRLTLPVQQPHVMPKIANLCTLSAIIYCWIRGFNGFALGEKSQLDWTPPAQD